MSVCCGPVVDRRTRTTQVTMPGEMNSGGSKGRCSVLVLEKQNTLVEDKGRARRWNTGFPGEM